MNLIKVEKRLYCGLSNHNLTCNFIFLGMAASKIDITVHSENGNIFVGNNMTINNYGQGKNCTLHK